MALLDLVNMKREKRGIDPLDVKDKDGVPVAMPEGIDFSVLWEEPKDPSSLVIILVGVCLAVSVLTLVVLFLKH